MEERKLTRKKKLALKESNKEQLAIALNNLGDLYYQQGRYEDAVVEYKEESRIYEKLGRRLEMAKANRMVGEMYMLLCEFENALKYVHAYLDTVKELGNLVEEQRAYATLGRAHLLHGQSLNDLKSAEKPLKKAEKSFIKSLLICKELSGQISKIELFDMQARLYLNIGVVKEHLEDFQESIKYMEKAIKICKINDLFELLHLCYMSVSLLYHHKKNDIANALKFCNLALNIASRLSSNRLKKECETLIIKSEIMIEIGDFYSAKHILHKAYKLKTPDLNDQQTIEKNLKIVAALCKTLDALVMSDSTNYGERKKLYEKMGDGCCQLQNYSKAIDYYLKMLENCELCLKTDKDLIPIYISLYQTYKDNKQYEMALIYLWKEYELNKTEPIEVFNTYLNIGEIYELQLKPFWDIYDIYQKAINEAGKINNKELEKIALIRLIKLEKKMNMHCLIDQLKEEAKSKGIDLNENNCNGNEEDLIDNDINTPDIGVDICLQDLTDSDCEAENCGKIITTKTGRRKISGITIQRNNKGETQLHQACISGNLNLVKSLLDQGHAINVRDHAGWLPLHEACNHGYRDIVKLLLDRGGTTGINDKGGTSCDGITPIYDACSNGYLDVVELLLERGANATLKTDFDDTPLNVLDEWRSTIELDHVEQQKYERIRSKLAEQLSKAGLLTIDQNTNGNKINNGIDDDDIEGENSLEKLRKIAYENDSDHCSEKFEIKKTSRSLDNDYDKYEDEMIRKRESQHPLNARNGKLGSAAFEYKNVMQNLKHPNRKYSNHDISNKEKLIQQKRKSGFLDSNDVNDDNWLEDDTFMMQNNRKKRKFLNDRLLLNEKDSKLKTFENKKLFENGNSNDNQDAFKILLESKEKQNNKKLKAFSLSLNRRNSSLQSRQQTKLVNNGFSRLRTSSCTSSECSELNRKIIEPDSTTIISNNETSNQMSLNTSINITSTVGSNLAGIITTIPFKIKVEDELLLVPVDKNKVNELNIRWLAEEASRRYYNIVGIKPVLRLMTPDGFAFEETDCLNVALQENSILAKVLEWNTLPLTQRYEEMCIKLNISVNECIRKILEKCQTTNNLILENFQLSLKICEPILKSLSHQTNLRILNLSNNFVGNEGCKLLGKSLIKLRQLKSLNLEGNCITHIGINYLLSSLQDNKNSLNQLEELNLNYNPLGNKSIEYLNDLCKNICRNIKKLFLSSCNITNFSNYDLNFTNLIDLDISFNGIQTESIKFLLKNLNSCHLQNLNLNHCIKKESLSSLGTLLLEFFQNGTCQEFKILSLQNLNLNDSDIYKIMDNFTNSINLIEIDLSFNQNLTAVAIQYIIDKIPSIKKIQLRNCLHIIDKYRLENLNLNKIKNFDNRGEMNVMPTFVGLTINNDCSYEDVYEILLKFWKRIHGDKAKLKLVGTSVDLYV